MRVKIIKKKTGYFVGVGKLTKLEQAKIKNLIKQDGTYQITGITGYVGIWTDNENTVYIEKSLWFATFEPVYQVAKKRGEKAIWDCKNKLEIWLIEQPNKKLRKYVKTKKYEYWTYWD
ncbi:MAG: hypothetical protein I3273_01365 [Candidatus Moeniiplasma glomeromycotorum]|nr:hypothetical protein [Candidatus Moeniiplasma glomeromycotorum]MCE8167229.1 hypothetical protein [Candidatus Moeniiplasma glomeromycotorum]MCE8168758.1 hypothetical protein [Candidatus Moeniiplasma glomeromycotorum]